MAARTRAMRSAGSLQQGWLSSILLTIPMFLFTGLLLTGGKAPTDPRQAIAALVTWAGINALFLLMLRTGRTYRYRSILFITLAGAFVISFSTQILSTRGSIALSEENLLGLETPFCHLVIPMVLLPAALTRTVIFPGRLVEGFAPIAQMLVIWVGATLTLGRGWCSWICFYGGFDEGFSQVARKPLIKHIAPYWRYLPYAVLLAIVLTSAITLSPVYCEWLCPFKTVTEFVAVTSLLVLIQTVIFLALFVGTVIVLPILTKRRTQCGLFCPFGAMQSLLNKINVFDVRIDPEKCVQCERCLQSCPTFSLDEGSLKSGRPSLTCTKCGRCIDDCPKGAIAYHIKGTRVGVSPRTARVLFVYAGFIFLAVLGGGTISMAIFRILNLVTTGRMW